MKHPFIENKRLYYYLLAWVVIFFAHATSLHFIYNLSILSSIVDGFVFNIIFLGLGLSYWYAVRFNSVKDQSAVNVILTHTTGVVILVFCGVLGARTLLKWVFSSDPVYMDFFKASTPWRFFVGILYFLNIILIYYLIRYYAVMQERMENESKLQGIVKETELDMLKSQINPHFIFNSLNSVSSLTITDPDKAQEMVIKLSDFLRYSLGKTNDEKNALKEELNNVMLYMEIERIRFGDRLNVKINLCPTCENVLVPNLIFQPIFENAIKYGVYENLGKVEIRFDSILENGILKTSVSNPYDPNAVPKKGKGIGLKNVSERLKLIYGQQGKLSVDKGERDFKVAIEIPESI